MRENRGRPTLPASFRDLGARAYSLVILLAVVYVVYLAFSYLFVIVFAPRRLPSQFAASSGAGVMAAVDSQFLPLDHYHGGRWVQPPGSLQGCTTSGCHAPLPHARDKSTRAFANFHVAFLDCQACHARQQPAAMAWFDPRTGKQQETPALLRLIKLLATDEAATDFAANDSQLRSLMAATIENVGGDAQLEYLKTQLDTSEPDSPVYRATVKRLAKFVPSLAPGEYAALIAPVASSESVSKTREMVQRDAEAFLAISGDNPRRAAIYDRLHADVRPGPEACLECHGPVPGRVDFAELGFTAPRTAQLHGLLIAQMIEKIRAGEPFYMPNILKTGDDQ